MANICTNIIYFYAKAPSETSGLKKLKLAFETCYPDIRGNAAPPLSIILDKHKLLQNSSYRNGDITYLDAQTDHIHLFCESSWAPVSAAVSALAAHFHVFYVLEAEECGCGIYINTDTEGRFLTDRYKVFLCQPPNDASMDALFEAADGNTDVYFESLSDLLDWFRNYSDIDVSSFEDLEQALEPYEIYVHAFDDTIS